MIQKTLVLIKPDGVKRGLIGEIISRFEKRGLKIIGLKLVRVTRDLAERQYPKSMVPILGKKGLENFKKMRVKCPYSQIELGKRVWDGLTNFLMETPVVAMVVEGINAIEIVRKMVGKTNPADSAPGTIRGDFTHQHIVYTNLHNLALRNLIHASDSVETAGREISLWFTPFEIYSYKTCIENEIF